ncbi:MAG: hypothetical protein KBT39_06600 [Bacteroidales bacterium]|nr:hypothetical protein [Bacteroidales bacterium]
MKKQYMKPSVKAIKIESTNIICGSGEDTQDLDKGGKSGDATPTSTTKWGYIGIFGE